MQEKLISRIAPTPSGYLHIGNVFNFLLTWLHVRSAKGQLLLRIDDLDSARVRIKYIDQIFRILDWLKFEYDAGPSSTEDFLKNYRQQYRIETYREYIDKLKQTGHTFGCQCSRKEILAASPEGHYPGTCKQLNLTANIPTTALRLDTAAAETVQISEWQNRVVKEDINLHLRDFIILRKDGLPAYQIASLADDISMKVNFIVRGTDLLSSSIAQMHLANLLHLGPFQKVVFHHHQLLTDNQNNKLSKSAQSEAVLGKCSAQELFRHFSAWMGWKEKPATLQELLEVFIKG